MWLVAPHYFIISWHGAVFSIMPWINNIKVGIPLPNQACRNAYESVIRSFHTVKTLHRNIKALAKLGFHYWIAWVNVIVT